VHEPELGVKQIQVVVQALPLPAVHLDGLGLEALADLETHTPLHRADNTDDPLGYPVLLRDGLGQLILALAVVVGLDVIERDDRTAGCLGQPPGVVRDPRRGRLGIRGDVLQRHTLGPQETPRPVLLVQPGQPALEDHPVIHSQTPVDPIPMKILEHGHHAPPRHQVTPEL
jgi:hypothetical protein